MPCESNIVNNVRVNCDRVFSRGIAQQVLIGRRSEFNFTIADGTAPAIPKGTITALVPIGSAKLKAYDGINFSQNLETGFTESEYGNNLPHTVTLVAFNDSQQVKNELAALAQLTDLFAIVKKNGKGGGYEVAGASAGLRQSGGSSNANDTALKGAYSITLSAPDEVGYPPTLRHETTGVEDTATYLATLVAADPS